VRLADLRVDLLDVATGDPVVGAPPLLECTDPLAQATGGTSAAPSPGGAQWSPGLDGQASSSSTPSLSSSSSAFPLPPVALRFLRRGVERGFDRGAEAAGGARRQRGDFVPQVNAAAVVAAAGAPPAGTAHGLLAGGGLAVSLGHLPAPGLGGGPGGSGGGRSGGSGGAGSNLPYAIAFSQVMHKGGLVLPFGELTSRMVLDVPAGLRLSVDVARLSLLPDFVARVADPRWFTGHGWSLPGPLSSSSSSGGGGGGDAPFFAGRVEPMLESSAQLMHLRLRGGLRVDVPPPDDVPSLPGLKLELRAAAASRDFARARFGVPAPSPCPSLRPLMPRPRPTMEPAAAAAPSPPGQHRGVDDGAGAGGSGGGGGGGGRHRSSDWGGLGGGGGNGGGGMGALLSGASGPAEPEVPGDAVGASPAPWPLAILPDRWHLSASGLSISVTDLEPNASTTAGPSPPRAQAPASSSSSSSSNRGGGGSGSTAAAVLGPSSAGALEVLSVATVGCAFSFDLLPLPAARAPAADWTLGRANERAGAPAAVAAAAGQVGGVAASTTGTVGSAGSSAAKVSGEMEVNEVDGNDRGDNEEEEEDTPRGSDDGDFRASIAKARGRHSIDAMLSRPQADKQPLSSAAAAAPAAPAASQPPGPAAGAAGAADIATAAKTVSTAAAAAAAMVPAPATVPGLDVGFVRPSLGGVTLSVGVEVRGLVAVCDLPALAAASQTVVHALKLLLLTSTALAGHHLAPKRRGSAEMAVAAAAAAVVVGPAAVVVRVRIADAAVAVPSPRAHDISQYLTTTAAPTTATAKGGASFDAAVWAPEALLRLGAAGCEATLASPPLGPKAASSYPRPPPEPAELLSFVVAAEGIEVTLPADAALAELEPSFSPSSFSSPPLSSSSSVSSSSFLSLALSLPWSGPPPLLLLDAAAIRADLLPSSRSSLPPLSSSSSSSSSPSPHLQSALAEVALGAAVGRLACRLDAAQWARVAERLGRRWGGACRVPVVNVDRSGCLFGDDVSLLDFALALEQFFDLPLLGLGPHAASGRVGGKGAVGGEDGGSGSGLSGSGGSSVGGSVGDLLNSVYGGEGSRAAAAVAAAVAATDAATAASAGAGRAEGGGGAAAAAMVDSEGVGTLDGHLPPFGLRVALALASVELAVPDPHSAERRRWAVALLEQSSAALVVAPSSAAAAPAPAAAPPPAAPAAPAAPAPAPPAPPAQVIATVGSLAPRRVEASGSTTAVMFHGSSGDGSGHQRRSSLVPGDDFDDDDLRGAPESSGAPWTSDGRHHRRSSVKPCGGGGGGGGGDRGLGVLVSPLRASVLAVASDAAAAHPRLLDGIEVAFDLAPSAPPTEAHLGEQLLGLDDSRFGSTVNMRPSSSSSSSSSSSASSSSSFALTSSPLALSVISLRLPVGALALLQGVADAQLDAAGCLRTTVQRYGRLHTASATANAAANSSASTKTTIAGSSSATSSLALSLSGGDLGSLPSLPGTLGAVHAAGASLAGSAACGAAGVAAEGDLFELGRTMMEARQVRWTVGGRRCRAIHMRHSPVRMQPSRRT